MIKEKNNHKGITSLKKFYDLIIIPEAYNFFMEFFDFKKSPKTLGDLRSVCYQMISQYALMDDLGFPEYLNELFSVLTEARKIEIAVMLEYEGVYSKEEFFQKFDTKEKIFAYFKPYGITLEQASAIFSKK